MINNLALHYFSDVEYVSEDEEFDPQFLDRLLPPTSSHDTFRENQFVAVPMIITNNDR